MKKLCKAFAVSTIISVISTSTMALCYNQSIAVDNTTISDIIDKGYSSIAVKEYRNNNNVENVPYYIDKVNENGIVVGTVCTKQTDILDDYDNDIKSGIYIEDIGGLMYEIGVLGKTPTDYEIQALIDAIGEDWEKQIAEIYGNVSK